MDSLGADVYPAVLRDIDLLSVLTDAVVISDPDGNVLYMNDAASKMHGFTSPHQYKKNIHAYIGEFSLRSLTGDTVAPENWPIRRVLRGNKFSNEQFWLSRAGSPERVLSYSGTPVYLKGIFSYAVLTIRDVTSEELTRQSLSQSDARFRAAVDHYPDPLVIYDAYARIEFVNKAAAERVRRPRDELIGIHAADLVPGAATERICLLEEAMDTRQTVQKEIHVKVGSTFTQSLLTYVPLLNGRGEISQVLGITQDLTEVHRTKKELTAMVAELESFAYAVSHDLRGPLRAIAGFSEILVEELAPELNPEHRDFLNRIKKAGLTISQLLDGIQRLARISTESYSAERVNLADIVRESMRDTFLSNSDVQLVIPDELWVYGDAGLLQLAIRNLVQNAIKFSRDARPPVIQLGRATEADGRAVYFVRDNGVGFDPAETADMFKPFCRFHHDQGYEGRGIGLAVVRRVLERHAGLIWAESVPGRGATFYFTLPSAEAAPL